ncbi:unnamed protein product, partial [Heterobilharzia americana]
MHTRIVSWQCIIYLITYDELLSLIADYYIDGNFCWDDSSATNYIDICKHGLPSIHTRYMQTYHKRQRRMVNRLKNA